MAFIPVQVTKSKERQQINGETIEFKPRSLVVDISITRRGMEKLPDKSPWFPAIIDTGNTHNLSIRASHLSKSTIYPFHNFPYAGDIEVTYGDDRKEKRPRHDGDLWVKSRLKPCPPFKIELDGGFTYYVDDGPKYPTIGLKTLSTEGLVLTVDYGQWVSLIAKPGPFRFGNYLIWRGLVREEEIEDALRQQRMCRRMTRRLHLVEVTVPDGSHKKVLQMRLEHGDPGKTLEQIARELNVMTDDTNNSFGSAPPTDFIGEKLVEIGAIDHSRMLAELKDFHNLKL